MPTNRDKFHHSLGFDDGKIRLVALKKRYDLETDFIGFLSV